MKRRIVARVVSPRLRPGGRRARLEVEGLELRLALSSSPIDLTFGQGGVAPTSTTSPLTSSSFLSAVATQPDGKILVAGPGQLASTDSSPAEQVVVVQRYNVDGTLDASFGTAGKVTLREPTPTAGEISGPNNIIVGLDGSILLAADFFTEDSAFAVTSDNLVFRLTTSGALDAGFGTGGVVSLPSTDGILGSVALQGDGRIIVAGIADAQVQSFINQAPAGFSAVRLLANGAVDTSFGGTGQAQVNIATTPMNGVEADLTSVRVDPAGRIVLIGSGDDPFGLVSNSTFYYGRIDSDGTPDATLGAGGVVTIVDGLPTGAVVTGAAVTPDGSTILATNYETITGDGATTQTTTTGMLLRVRPDGTRDTSFQVTADGVGYGSLVVQANGDILAAAYLTSDVASPTYGLIEPSVVDRYLPDGTLDPTFGTAGRVVLPAPPAPANSTLAFDRVNALALAPGGRLVIATNTLTNYDIPDSTTTSTSGYINPGALVRLVVHPAVSNDYDGDGKADLAAELSTFVTFAYRPSGGGADVLANFGAGGLGQTIPAPGDYDGDGKADVAAYLPAYGVLAYRPSSGGADVIVPFGIAGLGQSVPAPGDYDGDGKTDVAVYMPSLGILAYRPSGGGPDVLNSFGIAGAGQTIPAPGDYDGDGKTDVAGYLPALGIFAYRPSSGSADVLTSFGIPGAGQTIPAPGDYDGDGKTDVAGYLPSLGLYAYRPSSGHADVVQAIGLAGMGATIPAPGDYDGDGKTDVAVYIPALALFADRPSSGGADVVEAFGAAGFGQTVPAATNFAAFDSTSTSSNDASAAVTAANVPLVDALDPPAVVKKRRASSR